MRLLPTSSKFVARVVVILYDFFPTRPQDAPSEKRNVPKGPFPSGLQ